MFKKLGVLIILGLLVLSLISCEKNVETVEAKEQLWIGQYILTDEETGEFKIATVTSETEEMVTISFKSVRSNNEFSAEFKSSSGKYAVCNAGERCVKFNLKSSNSVITVDDIWINKDVKRNENWTGKYERVEDGNTVANFGNPVWNGRYINENTGSGIDVYAITEKTVLLSYIDEFEKVNIVLDIDDDKNCSYKEDGRTINILLIKPNKTIEISDNYDRETTEKDINLSGRYKFE